MLPSDDVPSDDQCYIEEKVNSKIVLKGDVEHCGTTTHCSDSAAGGHPMISVRKWTPNL